MNTLEEALEAIRTVESDRNYSYQQRVRVGGDSDTKVGAYGILKSRWRGLAADEGYAGADWRDPKAQDVIAQAKLQRDYEELGSWEMAAIAFRYGTQAARALSKASYIEPKSVEDAGYPEIGKYMRNLRERQANTEAKVEGQLKRPMGAATKNAAPAQKRSEDIVRGHLRTMLASKNKQSESLIGDQVEPAETMEEPV